LEKKSYLHKGEWGNPDPATEEGHERPNGGTDEKIWGKKKNLGSVGFPGGDVVNPKKKPNLERKGGDHQEDGEEVQNHGVENRCGEAQTPPPTQTT